MGLEAAALFCSLLCLLTHKSEFYVSQFCERWHETYYLYNNSLAVQMPTLHWVEAQWHISNREGYSSTKDETKGFWPSRIVLLRPPKEVFSNHWFPPAWLPGLIPRCLRQLKVISLIKISWHHRKFEKLTAGGSYLTAQCTMVDRNIGARKKIIEIFKARYSTGWNKLTGTTWNTYIVHTAVPTCFPH